MLPVWTLKLRQPCGQWDLVSLFNWDDQPADIQAAFEEIGLDPSAACLVYDCWNRVLSWDVRGGIQARVPAQGNALLAVHPMAARPQLVYSSRHLVQCGIGVEDVVWDSEHNTLSGVVHLVGNDATELVFAIPHGFELAAAAADDGVVIDTVPESEKALLARLRVNAPTAASRRISWTLHFRQD